jgi:hypothetical protein
MRIDGGTGRPTGIPIKSGKRRGFLGLVRYNSRADGDRDSLDNGAWVRYAMLGKRALTV